MDGNATLPLWAQRLKECRRARGWVEADLASELKKLRSDLPSVKSLAHMIRSDWETGKHKPGPRYRMLLAAVFGCDEADLFAEESLAPVEDDDMNRRKLLGLLGAAAAVPIANQIEPLRARLNGALTSEPTTLDADAWERVAADYAFEVGALPADQLLPELLIDFAELSNALTASSGLVRLQLLKASAGMAALTAITLVNAAETRTARRWWRTAARAADESGDHVVASLVRGRQAVFSLYGPQSGLGVIDVADEAITVGRNTAVAGVVSGYAAKAQAYAQLGRHEEAEATLRDLEALFERLPEPVRKDRSSQWGWSDQRFHHVASHVYTHAGNVGRAFAAQDRALGFYPVGNYQGRGQVELHRAGCLIRSGDVEEGAKHAVRVLASVPADCRDDGLLRTTALSALMLVAPESSDRPAMREAYEVLALNPGDR